MKDIKTIKAAIKSIRERGAKLDNDIQLTALDTLQHAGAHGDVTLVNELYLAMPAGSRRSALAEWLITFGKVKANEGKNKAEQPFKFAPDKTEDFETGRATMWHTMGSPEKNPEEVFDLQKALAALLKKASKAGSVSDDALLGKLRALQVTE